MRGKAVPQRMNADPLGDAGTPGGQANDPMQLARTRMLPAVAGKQPGLTGRHPALLARDAPPFMQYLKQDGRENDVSILLALTLFDPDEHPVTIDIGELERYDLRGSQAGGISQAQDRPVLGVRRRGEQPTDLLRAQNNGQAARLAGRDELFSKIVAFQCDLEEEPQCRGADVSDAAGAHSYAARGSRETTRADRETSGPSCARRATIHAISQAGWARE